MGLPNVAPCSGANDGRGLVLSSPSSLDAHMNEATRKVTMRSPSASVVSQTVVVDREAWSQY